MGIFGEKEEWAGGTRIFLKGNCVMREGLFAREVFEKRLFCCVPIVDLIHQHHPSSHHLLTTPESEHSEDNVTVHLPSVVAGGNI